MAKRYFTLKLTICKETTQPITERFYTVGLVPQGIKPNPRPQLTIKGRRLELIGFYVGCPVIIKIEQGKLVVEIDSCI
ncbi:SymE family type I addiction module toxin [Gilliamella sp. G0441]|uniref:SymE family type I addiction module toxin n=1 Tax=Gilliamella sp. G0441 TaxID=3384760 RepID=UPI003D33BA0D